MFKEHIRFFIVILVFGALEVNVVAAAGDFSSTDVLLRAEELIVSEDGYKTPPTTPLKKSSPDSSASTLSKTSPERIKDASDDDGDFDLGPAAIAISSTRREVRTRERGKDMLSEGLPHLSSLRFPPLPTAKEALAFSALVSAQLEPRSKKDSEDEIIRACMTSNWAQANELVDDYEKTYRKTDVSDLKKRVQDIFFSYSSGGFSLINQHLLRSFFDAASPVLISWVNFCALHPANFAYVLQGFTHSQEELIDFLKVFCAAYTSKEYARRVFVARSALHTGLGSDEERNREYALVSEYDRFSSSRSWHDVLCAILALKDQEYVQKLHSVITVLSVLLNLESDGLFERMPLFSYDFDTMVDFSFQLKEEKDLNEEELAAYRLLRSTIQSSLCYKYAAEKNRVAAMQNIIPFNYSW